MKIPDEDYKTLRLSEPGTDVALVELNRPSRYNAMTDTMFDELERAFTALDDEDGCRAVVLTGAGQAFCAGYDLADAEDLPDSVRWACWIGRNGRRGPCSRCVPCGFR